MAQLLESLRLAWWSSCALLLALLCGAREALHAVRSWLVRLALR